MGLGDLHLHIFVFFYFLKPRKSQKSLKRATAWVCLKWHMISISAKTHTKKRSWSSDVHSIGSSRAVLRGGSGITQPYR